MVQWIYAHFGFRFTHQLETRMRRFLVEHPNNQYGVHRYSPAQFGLSFEAVAMAFRAYLARFQPVPEVPRR